MDKKLNHLQMIQGVINRMASNSFMLKGWAVTLVVGIFALAGKNANKLYFLVAYLPICVFWILDSYYLCQERLYRALYNKIRLLPDDKIDFSMEASQETFTNSTCTLKSCLFSRTEIYFYFPLFLLCMFITSINIFDLKGVEFLDILNRILAMLPS